MPRKATPDTKLRASAGDDWYLVDWMASKGMTQAKLSRETGWPKGTVNDIYHGKTRYYRDIVNECARALQIHPYELLMPPSLANALRAQQGASITIVESVKALPDVALRTGTDG